MLFFDRGQTPPTSLSREQNALLDMIEQTQAVIYFEPDGTIKNANKNFQAALGYELSEIVGEKHAMFVHKEYRESAEYTQFWQDLRDGKSFSDQFPRRRKDGSTIWIQATYAPVRDETGKIANVIKIASDVTERRCNLNRVAKALHKLKTGDLTHRIPDCDVADIQNLISAYNEACDQLRYLVQQVQTANDSISNSSSMMRQSSEQLSSRTEAQASTLEETAAAIVELTTNAGVAADNAQNADVIASETREAAMDGGKVVEDVTEAMGRIEKSAGEISQIITVIDDLAFQTNLLSLNAGVEAARAGEAGRGFAVVATEVRALAQRSADSARDIKNLITQSSEHVSDGVELVGKASVELNKIFEGVGTISNNIKEISGSLTQQTATLKEINTAVIELDRVTQSNASMVLETTDVSKSLEAESHGLSAQITSFRTAPPSGGTWEDEAGASGSERAAS